MPESPPGACGAPAGADPAPSPADVVAHQLVGVADRLCREFAADGGARAESVREQVRQARAGFGSPRVITYLPVLIERDLRRTLQRARDAAGERPVPRRSAPRRTGEV